MSTYMSINDLRKGDRFFYASHGKWYTIVADPVASTTTRRVAVSVEGETVPMELFNAEYLVERAPEPSASARVDEMINRLIETLKSRAVVAERAPSWRVETQRFGSLSSVVVYHGQGGDAYVQIGPWSGSETEALAALAIELAKKVKETNS